MPGSNRLDLPPGRPGPGSVVKMNQVSSLSPCYANIKGPLAVAPMFLKNNRRIEALITVICLALLIFCLVERALRLAIAPALALAGLYAGRPAKPTGRLIFTAISRLRLIPATADTPPVIPEPPPLQANILALLDVDATRPR